VNAGTLLVNGTLTADTARVTVHAGATLGGTGTIGTTPGTREVVVENGGFLAPGDVDPSTCSSLAGRLTVNGDVTLQAGSTFRVQLGGMTAGVDYDQLRVNGAVNLSGSLGGAGGAVLDISFGYSVAWGSLWRIIDNDLADSIETRFQGLPDGAPVVPGVEIAYRAGDDSNDVVLTAPGHFDFDGPVTAPGYVSVPLSLRYADTPANDFGWSAAAPPLASFDRGLADALRSDGHYGYDGTFLVDVPVAGDYVVTPLIGDAAPFYHDLIEVTLEGAATPQLTLSTVAGQWGSPSLVVSSDTQLSLRLRNAGGVDPHYVINALRIRPRSAVSTLLIAPPSPGAALDADGITVDTYTGERAPAGSLVTVAATLGTVVAADDQDPTIQGIQVRADEAGAFTFRILRPSGLNTNPETAVITAQEVEGRALGQGEQEFQSSQSGGDDPTVMRFDFNASATYTHTNPNFLPVGPRDLYSGTRGYGWSVRVAAVDRPYSGFSYLNRDLHTGSNALFRVQVETGKTYNVRVYLANPLGTGGYQYTYDNFDVIVEGGTTEHIDVLQPNAITVLYLGGTDSNNDGILDIQFADRGGQNFNWVVSGIEMSTGSFSTDTEIQLVTGTLPAASPAASPAAGLAIDSAALAPVVTEAVARWSASRLTPAQAAILSDLHVGVSDLGGATLGVAYPTTRDVRIDDDAAGWGWSVIGDRSPVPGVDLLHVVMHEIGHLLGYGHSEDPDDLMAPVWSAGTLHPSSRIPDLATRIPHPSSPVDAVFGDRGREGGDESGAELLESRDTALLAAAVVRSSDEAAPARVPRRSGLQRYERELDDWFAQLAAVEDTMATDE